MSMRAESKSALIARVTEIAERVAEPEGIEIVDVEFKGAGSARLLRIYIDRLDGVSHADCEFISRNVGTILDVEDIIRGEGYTLEVSSPGLERRLKKSRDYERYVGRKIKVTLREPVAGKRHWEGLLSGFDGDRATVETASGEPVVFAVSQVRAASLKFEW